MKTFLKVTLVLSAFSALGGCIAVPAGPGYYPGGGYYAAPAVYGPSIGIGFYGGRGGHHWH
jgi:hypothetical protein